ncbi:MAG: hypothetical protein U1D69_05945, partial [Polynucleobacter sp.]|nr:hypothetical protein [Polynucleobacter sp.]
MYKFIIFILASLCSSTALANNATGIYALVSSPLTLIFVGIISCFAVYFIFVRFNRFAVVHGPESLTTFGILGCFSGIALALLQFYSSDLTNS